MGSFKDSVMGTSGEQLEPQQGQDFESCISDKGSEKTADLCVWFIYTE